MNSLPTVLISACLLGENVKYDGGNNFLNDSQIKQLEKVARLVPVCPEVLGGLPVPRTPAEAQGDKVLDKERKDVTSSFRLGALITLEIAEQEGAVAAILKERSPSCGVHEIYDGSFSKKKIAGSGVTTSLLRANGIAVFNEDEVDRCLALLTSKS